MSSCDSESTSVTRQSNENNIKLLQYANAKRIEGAFNDVTIQAGGQSISANRMVLSCFSKFFESMFLSSFVERYQDTVVIEQCDGESTKILIEFIYTGTIDINTKNVTSLLFTADFLQIKEAKEFCIRFLAQALTVENCLDVAKVLNLYNNSSALQQTYQYICEHFLEIAREKSFTTLSKTELILLVSNLDRNKVEEMSVYKGILNWVHHSVNRKFIFPELFEKIDLYKLPSDFVANEVAHEALVKYDLNCSNAVMYFAKKVLCSKTKTDSGQVQLTPIAKSKNANQSKIIRLGGYGSKSVVEIYNISCKSTTLFPDLPTTISYHSSVKIDNYIYCIGGNVDSKPTNKVLRMNLNKATLQWEEVASMIKKRSNFGAAAYDGNIVVTGGYDGQSKLNSAELYNVQENKWKIISSMKHCRYEHAVVAVRGKFYAIGGCCTKSVEQLKDLNGEWKKIQSMNCFRIGLAAVCYNGLIYAIGGLGEEDSDTVEVYDITKKRMDFRKLLECGEKSPWCLCVGR